MKKKKTIKLLLFFSVLFGILFTHFYAPRFITEIRNPLIQLIKKEKKSTEKIEGKEISFLSKDSLEISARISYSKQDSAKGTILLLHGIRSNKEHFTKLSNRLTNRGFNTVAIDLRAHGKSEGTHCTFGVKEKYDVIALIDFLQKTEKFNNNIGIWGQSLGAAVSLQTLGIEKRIKFGIIESTFSNFAEVTNDYFKFHLGFNHKGLTNYFVKRAGGIADFNPVEAKPSEYCEKINVPILMVHGTKDKRINIKYGKQNFSNLASEKKMFHEIENAHHLNVWKMGGEKYFQKVFEFIDEQCKLTSK